MSAYPVGINLIPAPLRLHEARRRRTTRWGLTVLIAATLSALAIGATLNRQATAAELRAQQRALEANLHATRTRLSEATETCHRLNAEMQRADALRSKRCWSGLMGLFARCLPGEIWLTSLATEPPLPVQGSGFRVQGSPASPLVGGALPGGQAAEPVTLSAPTSLNLRGYALDHDALYAFISALKQSGAFSRVELLGKAGAEPIMRGTAVRFELTCGW
jgi:Tfp pilus assembly protein PilN